MSRKRRIDLRSSDRTLKNVRGPNGRRLCRWCGTEVPVGRRTFCSDKCVNEWMIRSSPAHVRELIYKRDLGKCASCGIDTRYQKIELEDVLKACEYDEEDDRYAALLKKYKLTVKEAKKSLWQADHIIPVAENGGLCGLENYQSLCTSCHKQKTKSQSQKSRQEKKMKKMEEKASQVNRSDDKVAGLPGIRGFSGFSSKTFD